MSEKPNAENFLLVHISALDRYAVAENRTYKLMNWDKAQVKFDGEWSTGDIIYRGSRAECLIKGLRHNKGCYICDSDSEMSAEETSDSEGGESSKESFRSTRASISVTALSKDPAQTSQLISSDLGDENDQTVCFQIKLNRPATTPATSEQLELCRAELQSVQQEVADLRMFVMTRLAELSSNTGSSRGQVMYKNINLVTIHASAVNKFVTAVMSTLFSVRELAEGYVVDGVSTTARKRLDPDRIKLLKEALKVRYPEENQVQLWRRAREIANRKCHDATKKLNRTPTNPKDVSVASFQEDDLNFE